MIVEGGFKVSEGKTASEKLQWNVFTNMIIMDLWPINKVHRHVDNDALDSSITF